MLKIERLLSMIILFLDKQIISANTLAHTFEVSKRTIYRDIETLEFAGFPIISYPGIHGGFGFIDTFKLHTFTFTETEKQKIIEALQLQEQLLSFQKTDAVIQSKLQLTKNTNTKQANMILTSATLHNPLIEQQTNEKLEKLHQALTQYKKLKITYITSQGEYSQRTVLPIQLQLQNGSWYLKAFCELRSDNRLFKVTRIRAFKILDFTYDIKKLPQEQNKKSDQIEVQLEFTKPMLGKLYDFFTEEQMTIKNTKVEVTFLYHSTHNILPFLLMFGDQVQVLQPIKLKNKHIQSITNMKSLY